MELTGVGAVLTAARMPPGVRVAVVGAGGLGLDVVSGSTSCGAPSVYGSFSGELAGPYSSKIVICKSGRMFYGHHWR